MTFPSRVIAANSGAALTTLEGSTVTLPNSNGATEVTYSFSGVPDSDDIVESFDLPFTASSIGPASLAQAKIEVSLDPIGVAVPDSAFPSTDVPRYAPENIVVQEGSANVITKILYWTGINGSQLNQITLLNPSVRAASLTIDALNSSGQGVSGNGVTNPVKFSLNANQSLVRTVSELFGTSNGISSIRIQSTSSDVLATATVSAGGTAESVIFLSRGASTIFVPVVTERARLHLLNPASSSASGILSLRTAEGSLVTTTSLVLQPLASTTVTLGSTFSNPASGYVFGSFSGPVVAFESFGENNTLNMLAIEPAAAVRSLFVPFFAVGNGFQTDVNLLNVSEETFTLKAQLFSGTGASIEPNVLITIPPNQQLATAVDRLFSQVPATGYIRFEVPYLFKGFFPYFPSISGHARIQSSQGGSTVVPLSANPLQDAFIPGSGTGAGEFEGIVLLNPTTSAVTVTLQAMNLNGTVLSSTSLTLNPSQVVVRLTTEFFSGGLPPQLVIRVTSSATIVTAAITGSNTFDVLRSLPVLH
jgi:hypothetical protein